MGDGPRRQRANAWAWVYLALFGADNERTEAAAQTGKSAREISEETETR